MKKFRPLLLFFGLLLFSCNQTDDPNPIDPNRDPLENFETRTISVEFPANSDIDLEQAQLLSWDILSPLSEDLTGKVVNIENQAAFAYLFDKDDQFLLVGLIDSQHTKIDLASTAKVLLYWGLNGPFYEAELAEKFFKEVESFPIWEEWHTKVKEAFQKDPYFLKQASTGQELGKLIKEYAPNLRVVADEENKASDLLVDGDFQSGLQVYQVGLSQFEVANTFRRRVKGFLYKTKHTNSDETEIKDNEFPGLNNSKSPDMEVEIPTVTGITSFSGTVYDYVMGDTEKSFRVNTDPVNIPLALNEKNATWQLRVVGMGTAVSNMNQTEISASTKLSLLTFTLDFVVPLIGDALTAKAAAAKNTGAPKTEQDFWEALIVAVTGYLDKMPDVTTKIQNGELSEAVQDFFTIGYNQFGSIFMEDLARIAAESIWESVPANLAKPSLEDFKQSAIRKVKILTTIDLMLKGSDYARKVHDIKESKQVETFVIKANEIEVNLGPEKGDVTPNNSLALTAFIKSSIADDQVIEYEWSTTGIYGYLYDDIHEGKNFSSSKKVVNYLCTAEGGKIPENAVDTVTVTTYIKQGQDRIRIGSDKSVVNIKDKIVFTTGWEIYVPYRELQSNSSPTGIEYQVSSRGFKARFNYDGEVDHFELRNVKADGTKGGPIIRTPDDLKSESGGYEYIALVGSIIVINTYSEAVRDEWIEKFTKELEAKRDIYNSLEVTVYPK